MRSVDLLACGKQCRAYLPDENSDNAQTIYIHASEKDPVPVMKILKQMPVNVIWVGGANWEINLTPWPAPSPFKNSEPYVGEAEDYYEHLVDDMIPDIEDILGINPSVRAIAGYSLGGLFALYSSYIGDVFPYVASFSGSFWYDGWTDFMRTHKSLAQYVYLNLGKGETAGRNPVFSRVGECTRFAEQILRSAGVETCLEWYDGTHSKNVHERIAAGLGKLALRLIK